MRKRPKSLEERLSDSFLNFIRWRILKTHKFCLFTENLIFPIIRFNRLNYGLSFSKYPSKILNLSSSFQPILLSLSGSKHFSINSFDYLEIPCLKGLNFFSSLAFMIWCSMSASITLYPLSNSKYMHPRDHISDFSFTGYPFNTSGAE